MGKYARQFDKWMYKTILNYQGLIVKLLEERLGVLKNRLCRSNCQQLPIVVGGKTGRIGPSYAAMGWRVMGGDEIREGLKLVF